MRGFIRRYLVFIFIFFLAIAGVTVGYFYKGNISYQNPELVTSIETQNLVKEVGELIVLPTDEVPTVATVSDPNALKDKVFFKDAKKGDKVLIYTNARKAILYDPIAKKIVNVAPVNTGVEAKSPALSPNILPASSTGEPQF